MLLAPTVALLVALAGPASADLASELSAAESRAAGARADVAAARQRLADARASRAAAAQRAARPASAARAAEKRARRVRGDLLATQRRARAEIAAREQAKRAADDEHDEEVAAGIGIGIAALCVAALVLFWRRFRVLPAVVALARVRLGQAVALCLGGGFLIAMIGAAMTSGAGAVAAVGVALFCLGLALPVALLVARRPAQTEKARMPGWVTRGAAALLLLIGLAAILAPVLSDPPQAEPPPAQLRMQADALRSGPGAARLRQANAEAAEARQRATAPLARRRAAGADLRQARRNLAAVQRRLVDADAAVGRLGKRLEVALEREEREALREQRRQERLAEELVEEAEEESPASGCDESYSGCVPPYPPDVDCSEVGGPVSVNGSDPHGLDADGDGVGCE